MKKIVIIILFLALGIAGFSGYINYKKHSAKAAVENYLVNEKHISEDNIEKISPFMGNLQGDKNWLVYVKIKGDKKKYYYYKNAKKNRVILESYILNGKEYGKWERFCIK